MKEWPKEVKDKAKQDALTRHQQGTSSSRDSSGNFMNYNARGMEEFFDVPKLVMDRLSKMKPFTLQSQFGLTPATDAQGNPMTDSAGNPQFFQSGSGAYQWASAPAAFHQFC